MRVNPSSLIRRSTMLVHRLRRSTCASHASSAPTIGAEKEVPLQQAQPPVVGQVRSRVGVLPLPIGVHLAAERAHDVDARARHACDVRAVVRERGWTRRAERAHTDHVLEHRGPRRPTAGVVARRRDEGVCAGPSAWWIAALRVMRRVVLLV